MKITINLLPPEKKKELKGLRVVGVIFKIGVSAMIALVVLFVFLLFCVEAILIQKRAFDKEIDQFVSMKHYQEVKKSQEDIKQYNNQAQQIKRGFSNKENYWELINEINGVMPDDIFLKRMLIAEGTLRFSGFALHRETLLVLDGRLKESERFSDVESPISNIVANENIEFEFNMKIK